MVETTSKERDFFTGRSVLLDPYSSLDESRSKARVRELHYAELHHSRAGITSRRADGEVEEHRAYPITSR
jgi:hypothetical protein